MTGCLPVVGPPRKDKAGIREAAVSNDLFDGCSSLSLAEDGMGRGFVDQQVVHHIHSRRVAPSMSCYLGGEPSQDVRGRTLSDLYELRDELGSGASSTVYMATDQRTGESRAVKVVYRDCFNSGYDLETEDDSPFESEMQVLRAVDHPNIVRLFDAFESPGFNAFAMELCPGGNLFEYLGTCDEFHEDTVASVMRQVCSALAHLHDLEICHCDLKPENVLVAGKVTALSQRAFPLVKLVDFGVAAIKSGRPVVVGTSSYAAPEVLSNSAICEASGDIWSLGMLALVLLSGTDADTLRAIILEHGSIPEIEGASDPSLDCVSWCLEVDPSLRGSACAILAHDWLTEFHAREELTRLPEVLSRLQQFQQLTKMQRVMMQVAAYAMPAEQIAEQTAVFAALDANNDGVLSVYELQEGLERIQSDFPGREALIRVIDFDHSESVRYNEFVAACLSQEHCAQHDVLWRVFCAIDINDTGRISKENIQDLLHCETMSQSFGDDWTDKAFTEIDLDSHGKIDFPNFCLFMRNIKADATVSDGVTCKPQ